MKRIRSFNQSMSLFEFLLIIRNAQFCYAIEIIRPRYDSKQDFKLVSSTPEFGSLAKNDKQTRSRSGFQILRIRPWLVGLLWISFWGLELGSLKSQHFGLEQFSVMLKICSDRVTFALRPTRAGLFSCIATLCFFIFVET